MNIVVDTSALVAIFLEEPGYEQIVDIIDFADAASLSVVSRVELVSVLCSRRVGAERREVEKFVDKLHLDLVPVSDLQMECALDGLLAFGKGRHAARLNFGDCFSYGLAKDLGAALLFKGGDFGLTDIPPAWVPAA